MKKYLSKALLYKEWKAVYWILIPFILFSSKALEISSMLESITTYHVAFTNAEGFRIFFKNDFNSRFYIINFILVLIMSYLLINNDRKKSVSALIEYMPFTKKQSIFAKAAVGTFIILISNFIGFLVNMFMYLSNEKYLNNIIRIRYIVFCFIITLMLQLIIYLFLMCIQLVCKNGFFAMLLGISILDLPGSIENLIHIISFRTSCGLEADKIFGRLDSLCLRGYLWVYADEKNVGGKVYIQSDRVSSATIKLLIILIAVVILLIYISKKIKSGEDVMIKTSPKKEMAFKIFSSVSIGILFAKGLSRILNAELASSAYLIIINAIFIVASYFAYSRIDRIIKLSKYDRGE